MDRDEARRRLLAERERLTALIATLDGEFEQSQQEQQGWSKTFELFHCFLTPS